MFRLFRKWISLLIALLLVFPAAASSETVIVTSFYPIWLFTLNLTAGIDDVTVRNLAAPETGCLHDYTLQPSDMVVLSGADMLLINGAGMEAFLPMIVSAFPDLPVVDASGAIPLLDPGEIPEIGETAEDEGGNSHIWLDPLRASAMAENLAAGLIRKMPEHEETITANLLAFQFRMSALDSEMKSVFTAFPDRDVIIFHEAFPYFAEACGIRMALIVNKEPEDDLSASSLAGIVRVISSRDPMPVIIQSTEEDLSVNALVQETAVPVCRLDPLSSGPDLPPPDYYDSVMRNNLRILSEVFSGS